MKTFHFIICFLLWNILGQAQPQWISFSSNLPSKSEVKILTSTNQEIHYQVEILGMNQESKTFNGVNYQRLSVPGGQKWGDPGYPELPSVGKLLAVPECNGMNISIVFTDSLIFNGYNVYPTPRIVQDTSGGNPHLDEEFVKSDSIYGLNQSFPSVSYRSEEGGYIREQKVLRLFVKVSG